MTGRRHFRYILAFSLTTLVLVGSTALAEVPPRSDGGQTLAVPEEQLDVGDVYYVTPGMGTQFTWETDAELMRLVAQCSRVVGYLVAPFELEEGQPPLLGGAIRIPVASFGTDREQFNQELHGPQFLNRAQYPEITYEILKVTDHKLVSDEDSRKKYTLTLDGEFRIKDKAIPVQMPASLTMLPFTWATMNLSPGDLMVLRTKCEIKLADMDIQPSGRTSTEFTGETVSLEFYLFCSTVNPEKNFDPAVTNEQFYKQSHFLTLIRDLDDPKQGYEFGRKFMKQVWDNSKMINQLAWAALAEDGIKTRDMRFILEAAQRANELTEFKDPECLNTLARLHYDQGNLSKALEFSQKAIDNIGTLAPYTAAPIQAAHERYKAEAQPESE